VAVTETVVVVRAVAVLVGMRRRCAERQRRRWRGGDGVTRGDATTSRNKGAREVRWRWRCNERWRWRRDKW
jgi:hypothetical protein